MRFNTPFYVIACVAAITSWLLFHFQSDIVTLVSSSDLCDSEYYHIVQWGFPKIIFRCNLLRDVDIQNYPSMNIMIILDIWIASCCIISLIFSMWKLQSIAKGDIFQYLAHIEGKKKDMNYSKASVDLCTLTIYFGYVRQYTLNIIIEFWYFWVGLCLLPRNQRHGSRCPCIAISQLWDRCFSTWNRFGSSFILLVLFDFFIQVIACVLARERQVIPAAPGCDSRRIALHRCPGLRLSSPPSLPDAHISFRWVRSPAAVRTRRLPPRLPPNEAAWTRLARV